ncbi:MAG: ATP-binding cassette domain-containing protein [Bacteroidetes bacterium]|nr:ATP-binding cassette domain-containing protein [Bacteroidota bacterium]MBS1590691.1 ATP-binding cassette domain-containing protein [Bacteroidota bacterium]
MNHKLEIDSIQFEFNGRKILSDIYLQCETGKITGLLGKNGEGKSCLMNIIYGSLRCEKSVRFDNISTTQAFKQPNLLMYLPQFNFIPKTLSLQRIFQDFGLDYNKFQNTFSEFIIVDKKTSISNLSGGERRLIELYIIVKSATQFVMLDEPFTHLNPLQIEKVKELLKEEKANKGLLITDHMYRHVVDVYDNLYVLTKGKTFFAKNIVDIETLGYAKL